MKFNLIIKSNYAKGFGELQKGIMERIATLSLFPNREYLEAMKILIPQQMFYFSLLTNPF